MFHVKRHAELKTFASAPRGCNTFELCRSRRATSTSPRLAFQLQNHLYPFAAALYLGYLGTPELTS